MIKGILAAFVLVIGAYVFGALVVSQEKQKRFEARNHSQEDTRAQLVECVVNSLPQKAKDQIAQEQVDVQAPARLNKFRWFGGLPFVDNAWRLCNRKLARDFENGIEHDQLILQQLKADSVYQASVKKWKKVQAAELAQHDQEARQTELGLDELTYRQ